MSPVEDQVISLGPKDCRKRVGGEVMFNTACANPCMSSVHDEQGATDFHTCVEFFESVLIPCLSLLDRLILWGEIADPMCKPIYKGIAISVFASKYNYF